MESQSTNYWIESLQGTPYQLFVSSVGGLIAENVVYSSQMPLMAFVEASSSNLSYKVSKVCSVLHQNNIPSSPSSFPSFPDPSSSSLTFLTAAGNPHQRRRGPKTLPSSNSGGPSPDLRRHPAGSRIPRAPPPLPPPICTFPASAAAPAAGSGEDPLAK